MKKTAFFLITLAFFAANALGQGTIGIDDEGTCTPVSSDPQGLGNGSNTLFIDSSNCGCNDSHTRTQALSPTTPWCTPRAIRELDYDSKLNDGDTVYLRGSNYQMPLIDRFNRVVIVEDNVALRAYPGETPTIFASSLAPGSGGYCNQLCLGFSVFLVGLAAESNPAHGFTMDGIRIKGYIDNSTISVNGQPVTGRLYAPELMRIDDSQNVQIKNSSFEDFLGRDDIGYGQRNMPTVEGGRGFTINNFGNPAIGNGFLADNIRVRCADDPSKIVSPGFSDVWDSVGFLTQSVSNVTVQNSFFGDCPGNAIEFSIAGFTQGSPDGFQENIIFQNNVVNNRVKTGMYNGGVGISQNITVRNNIFRNYNQYAEGNWRDWGASIMFGSNTDNIQIYNNIFYDGGLGAHAIELRGTPSGIVKNTKIFHNTFYKAGKQSINLQSQSTGSSNTVIGTKIYNNLFYQVNIYAGHNDSTVTSRSVYMTMHEFEQNNGSGNEFKNNIFVPCDLATCGPQTTDKNSILIRNDSPDRFTYYSAATFDALGSFAQNNQDILPSAPMFVNAGTADFHLQPTSPAVNAAACLPEVTTDFDNKTRSLGGGCTIGAFEFDSVTAPVCGNGIIEGTETCDTSNLNSTTCLTLDFNSGTLTCNSNCTFNTSQCITNNPIPTPIACNENWNCSDWSTCFNGFQIRTCTDENHCGTILNTPITNQTCSTDNDQNQDSNTNRTDNNTPIDPNNPNPTQNPNNITPDQNQLATQPNGLLDTTKIVLITFAVLIVLGATLTAIKSMTE